LSTGAHTPVRDVCQCEASTIIHRHYAVLIPVTLSAGTPCELHVDMIMTQLDRMLVVEMTTVRDARVEHISAYDP